MGYDRRADPFAQVSTASAQARQEGKRILVMAGGDWCLWCRALHDFIHEHTALRNGIERAFVTVKIYVGDDNANGKFFATLPAITGVPHYFVLDSNGELLESVSSATFKADESYDERKILAFIERWQQPPTSTAQSALIR
jgi:thioredoxin-related protein